MLVTTIPTLLTYAGTSDGVVNFLASKNILKKESKESWKMFFSILSVALPTLVLLVMYEVKKWRYQSMKTQRDLILAAQKEAVLSYMTTTYGLNSEFNNLNMRIWIEEKNPITKIFKYGTKFNDKVFFVKSISNISKEDNKNKLYFTVSPNFQGLVGICYNDKETTHISDVSGFYKKHNLNPYQKKLVSDTKFVMCVPILNEKNQVIVIFSFDSLTEIDIPSQHKKNIYTTIDYFCLNLSNNIPDLWKKKG
ncbi:hypothetical protein FIU87_05490 [Bacillus sp. THAF10]|uniref:hypothetical protein n=1 Tax=Bacillus sp. THAF10 TaxID=2587848 RepID=UPI00126823A6|nr:hypothetical protein [Bacillus sp. THAF10]QFT88085.1 hypothetical protein FIU87_05490 [Bacillus sp. THAF10]